MIALRDAGDAGPDIDDHARALMAQDGGKDTFRIGTGQGEFVGMANARGLDFDQHLAGLRAFELNGFDRQRLAGLMGNCGTYIHDFILPVRLCFA